MCVSKYSIKFLCAQMDVAGNHCPKAPRRKLDQNLIIDEEGRQLGSTMLSRSLPARASMRSAVFKVEEGSRCFEVKQDVSGHGLNMNAIQ